jgi:hypothetical protein
VAELLKQALKEQEQDYSQGKIPAPPVDETQDNSQANGTSREHPLPQLKRRPMRLIFFRQW